MPAKLSTISRRRGACALLLVAAALPQCRADKKPEQDARVAAAPAAGGSLDAFRGYVAIDQALRERLFTPDTQAGFFLGRYFGENNETFRGLQTLLGGFIPANGSSSFQNGEPNAMNLLLWQIAFNGLAGDLTKACGQESVKIGSAKVADPVTAVIKRVCAWPVADAASDAALTDLWMSFVAYDAPESELDAWKSGVLADPGLAALSGAAAARAVIVSMAIDPYFLLGSP